MYLYLSTETNTRQNGRSAVWRYSTCRLEDLAVAVSSLGLEGGVLAVLRGSWVGACLVATDRVGAVTHPRARLTFRN